MQRVVVQSTLEQLHLTLFYKRSNSLTETLVDVWLETIAVGGFLNENRIFHNMYVLGNLLSKYEYMRTFCAYRVMINFDLITNFPSRLQR